MYNLVNKPRNSITYLITSLALGVTFPAFASSLEQLAPIQKVTLYSGSATVERSIDVSAGTRLITLEHMPANFDMQTLSIRSLGTVQIGQVIAKDVTAAQAVGEQQQLLDNQIQQLQDKIDSINIAIEAAEIHNRYIERMTSDDRASENTATKLKSIRSSTFDALQTIHQAKIDKRTLEKQLQALQQDRNNMLNQVQAERNLVLHLRAPASGKLIMTYQVQGAGWKPFYKARLNTDQSLLALERLAVVSQKTGEDWNNVKLTLSTGQPQLSPVAPEPQPWRLYYQPPAPPQAKQARYAMAAAAPMAMDARAMAMPVMEADSYEPPVLTQNSTFSTEFIVPSNTSILSDGQETTVSLSEQNVPALQTLRIAPRIDKTAILTASTPRPEGIWLAGDVQLYRDGGYVGKADWNPDTNSQMTFSFGKDDKVKVKVNRTTDKTDAAGLLSHSNRRILSETYSITNEHNIAMDTLVLESIPLSASGELTVKTEFSTPPTQTAWEGREGVYSWQQQLPANAKMSLNLTYQFTYPKDGYVPNMP